jgi:hypothetical protein
MGYKLFFDDIRVPTDIYPETKNEDWVIARTVKEFKSAIENMGLPDFVSFDNDLGSTMEEAKDVVKWMVNDKKYDLRKMDFKVHSANSADSGPRHFMTSLINNWNKFLDDFPEETKIEEGSIVKSVRDILSKELGDKE